jgi:hypothetical protein
MKKYIFIAGILLAFFALTFNSPATAIKYDNTEISWSDDTVKTAKTEKAKDADSKVGCHPSKCASKCGKKATAKEKACCDKPHKAGEKCPDKK